MLEMNFEVLQHFLTSMVNLLERLRTMYRDACHVSRQSLEFGHASMRTVEEARTVIRRRPIVSLTLISLALSLLFVQNVVVTSS